MAVNLLSLALDVLTPSLIAKLASGLGLDAAKVQKAVSAVVPAIFTALADKAAGPEGARSIVDLLSKQDAGLLGSIGVTLAGSGRTELISKGMNSLTALLGDAAVSGLAAATAKHAGIGEFSAKSILGLAGPVVLAVLGQQQKAAKLDATGLAGLLTGQKDAFATALPPEFARRVGDTGKGSASGATIPGKPGATAASPASVRKVEMPVRSAPAPHPYAPPIPTAPWWRLPLIAAALLAIGWYVIEANPPKGMSGFGTGTRIAVDGVDVGGQLRTTLDGLRTTLANVRDAGSGQAAVARLHEASVQLDRVSALAARMPPETRKALAANVEAGLTNLQPLFMSALSMSGPQAALKPVIDAVRAKLDTLTRS